MYEVILFDLDGTLLDTLDDLHVSVNTALTAFGYSPRTREEVRAFVGNGIAKLIERAIGSKTPDFEQSIKQLEQIASELETDNLTLDESVKKFEQGMKISKICKEMLDKAEKKITILVDDKEENFILEE